MVLEGLLTEIKLAVHTLRPQKKLVDSAFTKHIKTLKQEFIDKFIDLWLKNYPLFAKKWQCHQFYFDNTEMMLHLLKPKLIKQVMQKGIKCLNQATKPVQKAINSLMVAIFNLPNDQLRQESLEIMQKQLAESSITFNRMQFIDLLELASTKMSRQQYF